MKRLGKLVLVPATTIIAGRAYVGCLHGDTDIMKRSYVIACEGDTEIEKEEGETDAFTCRYKNGNTYPYLREELYKFVLEYDVPSLANPRKIVGKNQIDIASGDIEHIVVNKIGSMGNHVEALIDFDSNTAKLLTKDVAFSLSDVITILESMKSNDKGEHSSLGEYAKNLMIDQSIDIKIAELKTKYNG